MESYSEEEILYGLKGRTDLSGEHFLSMLKRNREKSHVHDLTDEDTVTVKEVKDAQASLRRQGFPSVIFSAEDILRRISESREGEPEYPYASIWKDRNGITWFRCSNSEWMRFGYSKRYSHGSPQRPLKKMDVAD